MFKRQEVIPWAEFFSGEYKPKTTAEIVIEHIERNKVIYKVAGVTVLVLFTAFDVSVFADTNIDEAGEEIFYKKLVPFGKWALLFKGGWDTVSKAIKEDHDGAKKSALGYLLAFLLLLGLPYGYNQIEDIFLKG